VDLLGMEPPAAWPADDAIISSAIQRLAGSYDVVFVDCPPSEGVLLHAALRAATVLLIPLHADYFSMNGLSRFIQATQAVVGERPYYLVLNRLSRRRRLDEEVRARLESYFGDRLLQTGVREAIAIAESPGFGQSLFQYAPGHGALMDYRALAHDLLGVLGEPSGVEPPPRSPAVRS
jgi:chromosome partitioning protein